MLAHLKLHHGSTCIACGHLVTRGSDSSDSGDADSPDGELQLFCTHCASCFPALMDLGLLWLGERVLLTIIVPHCLASATALVRAPSMGWLLPVGSQNVLAMEFCGDTLVCC